MARYETARLVRGCLHLLRHRGRAAGELAGVVEAFTRGADDDVAKELEALPPAVRSRAAAQLDQALTDQGDGQAAAEEARELLRQAEQLKDKLVRAGLMQSNTGSVLHQPTGPVAIGPTATAIGTLKVKKGDVSFGGGLSG